MYINAVLRPTGEGFQDHPYLTYMGEAIDLLLSSVFHGVPLMKGLIAIGLPSLG